MTNHLKRNGKFQTIYDNLFFAKTDLKGQAYFRAQISVLFVFFYLVVEQVRRYDIITIN